MRLRRVLLCTLALTLAARPAADAAKKKPKPKPKPLCNLLTDEKGDGDWNLAPVVESPNVDIVGGDIATGPKTLVAVLRLSSLDLSSDNWANLGYTWTFGATANGTDYSFSVRTGLAKGAFNPTVTVGKTTYTNKKEYSFDRGPNYLKWTITRKDVPEMKKPKLTWLDFRGNTKIFSSTADEAFTPGKRYPDRAPSCVRAT